MQHAKEFVYFSLNREISLLCPRVFLIPKMLGGPWNVIHGPCSSRLQGTQC